MHPVQLSSTGGNASERGGVTTAGEDFSSRAFQAHLLMMRRTGKKVPQTDIAERVSALLGRVVSPSTVGRWLKDGIVPDVPSCLAFAKALGCDPGWLTFGYDSAAPEPTLPAGQFQMVGKSGKEEKRKGS